jgi:tetratricopeptide (TPR) repeat protein
LTVVLWRVALVASFFFALSAVSLSPVGDPDTWWHLETGKRILDSREIPRTDPYSFTAVGNPWVTHEWLFEVVSYGVYSAAGLDGLIVGKFLLVAATFGVLLAYGMRRKFPIALQALFLLTIALLSMGRFTVRPHIFTYLFLALTLLVLYDYRDFSKNRLALLPFLFLIWANFHSGFLFGLGILGVFTLLEAWSARRVERALLTAVFASIVATFLNPNGYDALLYPLRLSLNPTFKSAVAEHNPIYHPIFRTASFVMWFHVVAAITAGFAVARLVLLRRIDRSALAVCLLFLVGTVLANRNRALFGITAVPVVAGFFVPADGVGRGIARLRSWVDRPVIHAAAIIALLVFGARVFDDGIALQKDQRRKPAFGISRDTPEIAAEFIRRNDLRGNMLNEYRFGGYLIWALAPERPVFIDGRNFVYGESLLEEYRRVLNAADGFQAILDRHEIEYLVVRNSILETGAAGTHPLLAHCATTPDWTLVHADDAAVVYARSGSINASIVERFGYRHLEPFAPGYLAPGVDREKDRREIEKELTRLLAGQPEGIETWVVAASVFASLGERARAIDIYGALGERLPENADVSGNRGVLLAQAGRYEEAVEALQRAIRLDPESPRRTRWEQLARDPGQALEPGRDPAREDGGDLVARADSLAAAGELPIAIGLYQEAVRLNPGSSRAHFGLGDLYWKSGRVEECLSEYHVALSLDSTYTDLLNNLGFVYGSQGDLERAREYWTRAAKLDPTHDAAENLRKLEALERRGGGE